MKFRILVIGLGRLGDSLVRNLSSEGAEIIALDNDPQHIENIKNYAHVAVIGDSTDIQVLKEIGAQHVDRAIICIGGSFEASILTFTNLQELKIKNISVRATTAKKAQILKSIGATEVFFVEEEMGKALALQLTRPSILHSMELDFGLKIVEWQPATWAQNKPLSELDLPKKFKVQVIAIRDQTNPKSLQYPNPNVQLSEKDLVLLLGLDSDVQKLINLTE